MKPRSIESFRALVCACFVLATAPAWAQLTQDHIVANRHAKIVCSGVFISGRTAEDVLTNDHQVDPASVDIEVDRDAKTVTVTAPDGYEALAVYRKGCGCTLAYGASLREILGQSVGSIPYGTLTASAALWPEGDRVALHDAPEGVDTRALSAVLDDAFLNPDPDNPRGTRGVVVVYDGRIVAERYAPGFHRDMPLIAWSMTKSITGALVGILVKDGKLDIHAPAPVPEWEGDDDPRALISMDHLMRMSSGLKFEEVYQIGLIDVVVMLYGDPDSAHFAAKQPPKFAPDEKWAYSSGTTNIIQRILKDRLGGTLADYAAFPYEALFNKLGMHHTEIELDRAGTYIGSSFMFSTPRDMARFGQFCMQDGVLDGERILPEGWIDYVTTPTPGAPNGVYGAQFWLNAGDPEDPAERRWPDLPRDAYGLSGFQGQSVAIVPSRNAVIVRMGHTPGQGAWDLNGFLAGVLSALPE